MIVNRAEVEKLFLSLSRGRDIYVSTTFLDASGQETMGTIGAKRRRPLRSLAEIAGDGPLGGEMLRFLEEMQSAATESLWYGAPFRDAQNRLTILAGMKKQDPESGGFAGAVIQHCDLSSFISEASRGTVLGAAVVWVYGSDGENLLSPPAGAVRQDPARYLTGEKPPADVYLYTAVCRLFGREKPLMTVVCSIPREIVSRQLGPVFWSVIMVFSILLAGSLVSSLLISRWVSEPIRNLTQAVRNVNGRSLDLDLDAGLMESEDEMGVLAQAFGKTIQDLKASTTSVDHLNREIAQRKHAESRLAYLASFPERNPSPVMEVDLDGAIRYANPAALDLFPDLRERDKTHPWLMGWATIAHRFREGQASMDTRDVIIGGRSYQQVFHYFAHDGFIRVYGNDITERKRAEQEQARLLTQLGETNRELTDFAYVVSHDLKAPLRAIRTVVDWLSADYADQFDEQGREYLTLLVKRATRMHNLIDGVLQYSRIGRTEEKAVPVDLGKLVPEIVESLGAPENISIEIEPDLPTVRVDGTRIAQVFQNLLSNAIKYMDKPQGHITVACVEEDDSWTFSVSDNGPGIERKYVDHVFKLFQTLASRDDCESTGVGLTVTKKIVELYGGRIWVESEVGRGSTFLFTLPKHNERRTHEEYQACAAGRG
jgi:signal transduction histidine kinase